MSACGREADPHTLNLMAYNVKHVTVASLNGVTRAILGLRCRTISPRHTPCRYRRTGCPSMGGAAGISEDDMSEIVVALPDIVPFDVVS